MVYAVMAYNSYDQFAYGKSYIVNAYVGCALCSHGLYDDCLIVICAGMMYIAVALYVASLKV